jgi:DMSO/TMAO reductase YedYZ molybdopterin-dependent catalytic subunit
VAAVDIDYIICRESRVEPAAPLTTEPETRPTPLAALALDDLPTDLHFVRSHFGVPPVETARWRLAVGGAVAQSHSYSLAGLRCRPTRTQTVVLECAGHRRGDFSPATPGLQWGVGAVSEARWTGIPLGDLLGEVSPTDDACEVVFEGADRGLHRSAAGEVPFARSLPLERALAGDVLLAWEMNGAPIPPKHGGPLRVIVPGSYGVASVKWLRRITVVDHAFAGPFQAEDYRLNGEPLQDMRINSLIVAPEAGGLLPAGATEVTGVAWGGRGGVAEVELRVTGGPWRRASLVDRTGLSRWTATVELPPGAHVLESRARDRGGAVQPEHPEWNAGGYANNGVHRVRVSARPA